MSHNMEYTNSSIGGPRSSYMQVRASYGGLSSANNQVQYDVPKLCSSGPGPNYPPSYTTLQHDGADSRGGYFTLQGAYPHSTCSSCNVQYVKRPCSGGDVCGAAEAFKFRRRR